MHPPKREELMIDLDGNVRRLLDSTDDLLAGERRPSFGAGNLMLLSSARRPLPCRTLSSGWPTHLGTCPGSRTSSRDRARAALS